jgi:alpha,alpha-trehalase
VSQVIDYIKNQWDQTVRHDTGGSGFLGIDLPHPYTTPCIEGTFTFFFYWDTYFTHLGLLRHGRFDLVAGNLLNMAWLIRTYGMIPNHVGIDHRSQCPYFSLMVEEYLRETQNAPEADRLRAQEIRPLLVEAVSQEYFFWYHARTSPTGLARCGNTATTDVLSEFYDTTLVPRLGLDEKAPREERLLTSTRRLSECESGWDFTERFEGRADEYAVIEFNSNLLRYESLLGSLYPQDQKLWDNRLNTRKRTLLEVCWDDEAGVFLDYDFVNEHHSPVASAATFQPLFAHVVPEYQADRVAEALIRFERKHGVAVTEETPTSRRYQWGYPNMWPPMVWVTVKGLANYGYHNSAQRVAEKYVLAADTLFASTGQLWEIIDVETGAVAGGEYEAQPMMGWSAGVYVALWDYLQTGSVD